MIAEEKRSLDGYQKLIIIFPGFLVGADHLIHSLDCELRVFVPEGIEESICLEGRVCKPLHDYAFGPDHDIPVL